MCGDVCHRNEGGRGKGAGGRGPGKPPSEGKTRAKASVGRGPPETRNRAECVDAEGCTVKGRASADDRAWGAHALPRASGRPRAALGARGPGDRVRPAGCRGREPGTSVSAQGRPRPRSHVFCPLALSGSWPVVRCPPGRGAPYSANPADTRTDTAVCASRSPARGRVRSATEAAVRGAAGRRWQARGGPVGAAGRRGREEGGPERSASRHPGAAVRTGVQGLRLSLEGPRAALAASAVRGHPGCSTESLRPADGPRGHRRDFKPGRASRLHRTVSCEL